VLVLVFIIKRSRLTFTQRFTTSTGLRHAAAAHSHTIAMAEDWEQEDWEAEDFKPVLPAKAGAAAAAEEEFETAGQAVLAKVNQPDMSKFADEDAEDEPAKVDYSIKPQVGQGSRGLHPAAAMKWQSQALHWVDLEKQHCQMWIHTSACLHAQTVYHLGQQCSCIQLAHTGRAMLRGPAARQCHS
jgi:hypothetical protein